MHGCVPSFFLIIQTHKIMENNMESYFKFLYFFLHRSIRLAWFISSPGILTVCEMRTVSFRFEFRKLCLLHTTISVTPQTPPVDHCWNSVIGHFTEFCLRKNNIYHIYIYIYVCVCVSVCARVYIYIYIYILEVFYFIDNYLDKLEFRENKER